MKAKAYSHITATNGNGHYVDWHSKKQVRSDRLLYQRDYLTSYMNY